MDLDDLLDESGSAARGYKNGGKKPMEVDDEWGDMTSATNANPL